jgi:hypothetical protein
MKITYNISFYIHESVTNREIFIKNLADSVLGKTLSSLYGMGKPDGRPADTITARQIAICELLDKELNVTLENDSGVPYIDRSGKTRFYSDIGKSELTFNCKLCLGDFVDFSNTLDATGHGYTLDYNDHELWRCRCEDDGSKLGYCENSLYDENLIDDAKMNVVLDTNIESPSIMMNDLLARIGTIELYNTLASESFGQPISVVDRDYPHDSHDTEPVVHPPVKKAANAIKVTTVDAEAPEAIVSEEPVETAEPPKTGGLETIYPKVSAKEVDAAKFYKAATFAIASLDMDSILEVQTFYSKKYNSETNREPWAHMNEKILMKLLAGAVMKHCDELVELMKTNAFSFKNNMYNRKILQLDGITESVFVGEITTVGDDWAYLIEYSPIRCFGTSDGHS